jgi:hypothetical protein
LVFTRSDCSNHKLALLGLVRATYLLEFVFTIDELKAVRKKIDLLTLNDDIGNGVREAIEEIEAAALAAVKASEMG